MADAHGGTRLLVRIAAPFALLFLVWARGSANTPTTIRVLTYNIHHGEGRDGDLNLPRLGRVIADVQPDLVALQEVDVGTARTGEVNQLAELARLTGMYAQFGKAMDYMGGGYGVAVLSRWAILSASNQPLPSSADREPRTGLTVQVRAGEQGPVIQFTSTHLDQARPEDRVAQATYLNELLVGNVPTILAGDMNARPNTDLMKIFEPWWTEAPSADPAPATTPPRPTLRGDHILFRPAERWRPIESRIIDETVSSDHRPVLVVLEWTGDLPSTQAAAR